MHRLNRLTRIWICVANRIETQRVLYALLIVVMCCTTATAANTPENTNRAIWLVDDFEDGYLWDTWTDDGGSCNPFTVTPTIPCPEGDRCLEIFGDCGDFYEGISTNLGGFEASSFSIYIRSDTTNTANAYIVLDDDDDWLNGTVAFFFGNGLADWMFSSGGIGYNCGPRVASQWYLLRFDFDWTSRTVDVFIDGNLRHADIPMTSATATGLNAIYLFNYQAGTAFFDLIVASSPPPQAPLIFMDGFESGDCFNWSLVVGLPP